MKKIILSLVLISFLLFPTISLAAACSTYTTEATCVAGDCIWDTTATSCSPSVIGTITRITSLLQTILYTAAALFIVIAAFNFITAAGDVEKVKTARMYVLYALVGVIVAILAGAMVNLVKTTTGA
jgi:hypothetical protein